MWKKEKSIITNQISKEQMWKLYQNIEQFPVWDKGIEWTKLHGKFSVGTHYTLKPKGGPQADIEIIRLEEHKRFDDVTHFFGAEMYGEHILEETPDGLKITVRMSVEGPLAWIWIHLVANGIINELPETFQRQIEYAKTL